MQYTLSKSTPETISFEVYLNKLCIYVVVFIIYTFIAPACSIFQSSSFFFFLIYCVYLSVCNDFNNVNNTGFCLSFKKKQSSVLRVFFFCFISAEKHKHASFFNRGNLISNAASEFGKMF